MVARYKIGDNATLVLCKLIVESDLYIPGNGSTTLKFCIIYTFWKDVVLKSVVKIEKGEVTNDIHFYVLPATRHSNSKRLFGKFAYLINIDDIVSNVA